MSNRRSQKTGSLKNPNKLWFEVNGADGVIFNYDSEAKEKITHKLPFVFMLVKNMSGVTGFHPKRKGLVSNEVSDINKEPLRVRFHQEEKPCAIGLWKDIKDDVIDKFNGKFLRSSYIAIKGEKGFELANIKLTGKSLWSFTQICEEIEQKGLNIYEVMFLVKEFKSGKKGAVTFKFPLFSYVPLDETVARDKAAIEKADELYEIIDDYHQKRAEQYSDDSVKQPESDIEEEEPVDTIEDNDSDDPFVEDGSSDDEISW